MADSCRVISIINYKGGVGKTTIALQLACGLATLHHKRVLMLDLDPQCSLSVSALPEEVWIDHIENRGSIRSILWSYYEGNVRLERDWIAEKAMPAGQGQLDLVPCHLDLPDYEMRLVSERPPHATDMADFEKSRHRLLRDAIEPHRKDYDFIICDCPPNIYFVSRSAILASDCYLVPTIPDFISCYGIPFIENHIQTLLCDLLPEEERAQNLGIIRNRVRRSGSKLVIEHERQSRQIKEMYPDLLFETCIQDRIGVSEVMGQRKNIFTDTSNRLRPVRSELEDFVSETILRMNRLPR
jgi:chromosome partitioning protein